MKKKPKNKLIDRMPLDCWCHMILFFQTSKEFFSAVYTIKGLYLYVQKIAPQCTKNVEFPITGRIPYILLPHISNIKCEPSTESDTLRILRLNGVSGPNLTEFFCRILKQFSHLMKLNVILGKLPHIGKFFFQTSDPRKILLRSNQLGSSANNFLSALSIVINECEVEIDHDFKNLEILVLKVDYEDDDDNVIIPLDFPKKINFSKLPKLRHIFLNYVTLEGSLEAAKEHLDFIFLDFVRTKDVERLIGYPNLKRLRIGCSGNSSAPRSSGFRIGDLISLRCLDLELSSRSIMKWNLITGFPNLKYLTLRDDENEDQHYPRRALCEIKHLPRLTFLEIQNVRPLEESCKYRLIGLRGLKIIRIQLQGAKLEIPDPGKNLPVLERIETKEGCDFRALEVLLSNLKTWKKTLKGLYLVKVESEGLGRDIVIDDFSKLEIMFLEDNFVLTQLTNCPALETLSVREYSYHLKMENLDSLNHVCLERIKACQGEHFANHFIDIYSCAKLPKLSEFFIVSAGHLGPEKIILNEKFASITSNLALKNMKHLEIKGGPTSNSSFSVAGEEEGVGKHCHDCILWCGTSKGGVDEITITGVSNLRKIIVFVGDRALKVKDCRDLKEVIVWKLSGSCEEILLENLPKLEKFSLDGKGSVKRLNSNGDFREAKFYFYTEKVLEWKNSY